MSDFSEPATTSPAADAEAITPSNTTGLTRGVSRGIWVGGTGDIAVLMASGVIVTYSAVPAGTLMPICVKRVNSTNTTATLMVAMY